MIRPAAVALFGSLPLTATAGEYFTLRGHGGPVMHIDVGPDGTIATASFDNSVGLWSDGAPLWLEGHDAAVNVVAIAPDGTVWSGSDDFTLRRWGDPPTAYAGHKGKVMAIAFGPGGLVATASWDGTIGLWGQGEPRFLTGHGGPVNDVAFAPDGTLYSASADGTIRAWDTVAGKERQRVVEHGFGVNEIVLNKAGTWLAYGAVDGGTRALSLEDGRELADLTLDRRPILALALSPDDTRLAVGDGEGYIMIVDTASWRIARDFRATAKGPVWALAFSADGSNIHAGGLDDTMYSWPLDELAGQMPSEGKPFLAEPDSLPNGERQFKRKCAICHTLTPDGARRAGPSLFGLFGRRAGTVPDYRYSDALTGTDLVWTDATIDALFDIGPEHYIPGTKMPMQRIADPRDRADLIDYLRTHTVAKE